MQVMDLDAVVRPGQRWPHSSRIVRVRISCDSACRGVMSVSPLDPHTEQPHEDAVVRQLSSLSDLVSAMMWCDRALSLDRNDAMAAWDRELCPDPECAVCLEPVETDVARCPSCPVVYHRPCVQTQDSCPVCRASW